jgi:hypothetical protein
MIVALGGIVTVGCGTAPRLHQGSTELAVPETDRLADDAELAVASRPVAADRSSTP